MYTSYILESSLVRADEGVLEALKFFGYPD